MRRGRLIVSALAVLALAGSSLPAGATHVPDQSFKMSELFTSPNGKTNSDFAFWGDYAFVGYYTGDAAPSGGVRIFDISNPAAPRLLKDVQCDGLQADPIVWDRNGNGIPDLLLLAVDRTMDAPQCGAPRSASHANPAGWEGVRVFEMSDDPANPFATVEQVKAVYTDCGAHTITAWPKDDGTGLLVYVSSYPLRSGPTCGEASPAPGDGYQNTANPYDEDPGSPNSPLHGVIQIVDVPFANPAAANELDVQPAISYPGDPDGKIEWFERGLGPPDPPVGLEPAAVACHDIAIHVEHRLAGAACAEQGQVWEIDENGIPDTANPILIGDDEVTSGGTGDIPGAIDFFHSVMFDNDATVVNWVDESFGSGCPTMTTYQPRPWNPAGGTHKTGRMFFSDMESGAFVSEFHVGDVRPDPGAGEYCSAHMGMAVMGIKRDLLVNAWYTGGVNVIDFTKPARLKEIAYYDPQQNSGTWSAYPYTGPQFKTGPGIPVYASDGVTNNALADGMVVYRAIIQKPGRRGVVDHLNPQTMDFTGRTDKRLERFVGRRANLSGAKEVPGPGDPDGRGKARIRLHANRGEVCYRVSWKRIESPFAAHIHEGRSDVAGPVVVTLFQEEQPLPENRRRMRDCIEGLDRTLVADIMRSPRDYYVNVHNPEFPDGAIRGQLFNP